MQETFEHNGCIKHSFNHNIADAFLPNEPHATVITIQIFIKTVSVSDMSVPMKQRGSPLMASWEKVFFMSSLF